MLDKRQSPALAAVKLTRQMIMASWSKGFRRRQCLPVQILVIEGLHPFYDDRVADLCDFKIYLDISDEVTARHLAAERRVVDMRQTCRCSSCRSQQGRTCITPLR